MTKSLVLRYPVLKETLNRAHVIENGVLRPDEDKVEAINRITILRTKTEVKSLLGLTGYYADFIPKYQEKAFALTELLKRSKPDEVQRREVEQKALDELKAVLISFQSRYSYHLTLHVHIYCKQMHRE